MLVDDTTRLIEGHLGLAARIAHGYRGRGVENDDLEQVARLALVKAAHHYDPGRGVFTPFAATTIRGELKRHFRDRAWHVRPPRRLQELQARLSADHDEHPHDADPEVLAERLGVTANEVREAIAARGCYRCDSIDDGDDGPSLGVQDAGFAHVDDWLAFCSLSHGLDQDERRLLTWRFLQELTQQQIADRLGISQMQVSRRLSALLARLRSNALSPVA